MKKNVIAVCDTEGEYACNFAEYLNSRKKLPFQAEAFTDVEKLRTYAGKNPPEILLIAEANVNEQIKELGTENMILLTENREQEEGHKSIYKYQSAESVIQEVMAYYVENTAPVLYEVAKQDIEFIGVYSPVGRSAKTLLALTIGQILGEEKSVLYLNMESYSGFENLFDLDNEKNLTDLFYILRCRENLVYEELQGFIKSIGKMDFIPPVVSPEDIHAIGNRDWLKLFDFIRQGRHYERVILDLGDSVAQIFQMLAICRTVYVPVQDDVIARCKLEQFRKLVKQWGRIEQERIKEIRLPACGVNLSDTEFINTLAWGKWGGFIRRMLERNG